MIKYGKPVLFLKYKTIKYICYATLILNVCIIIYSIDIFVSAIQIKLNVGNFINLITNNDGNVLPNLLALAGLLCFILNIISIFFLYQLFNENEKRSLNTMVYALVMICLGSVFTMFIICITVLSHSYSSHEKVHNGITEAMSNYSSNSLIKSQIDMLQIQFQCCGSKTYVEWYDIKWYDDNFEKLDNVSLGKEETPFSCCSIKSIYPCIHHGMASKILPYRYSPDTNLSVSTQGCFTAIKGKKKTIGWQIIGQVFIAIVMQILMLAGLRFLQTAHFDSTNGFYDESASYRCWLIGVYVDKPEKTPPPIPPIPSELMD